MRAIAKGVLVTPYVLWVLFFNLICLIAVLNVTLAPALYFAGVSQ